MRRRILTTALAATLAVAGLAGCRTNVGVAARIDGHKVTESQVNDYITAKAKPVSQQSSTGGSIQVSPRSFVLEQLIDEQLGFKLLEKLPGGAPSSADVNAKLAQDLNGKSERSVAESLGLKGYTDSFYKVVLRVQELSGLVRTAASQQGVDIQKVIKSIHFPVWVSPRYGRWDAATLSFDGTTAVPSFVKLQPAG